MMDSVRKGAEADIRITDGIVIKERVEKKYRHPEIDRRIRRLRTRREAKNLERASEAGVKVPKLLGVDEKNHLIRMSHIEGRLLKDVFEGGEDVLRHSKAAGAQLRVLHDADMVHNDLTTSNIILSADGSLYFIDFGLAFHTARLEDKAMDLVVFKKSIQATHTKVSDGIWEGLLVGYKAGKEIKKRVETIEKRARYK